MSDIKFNGKAPRIKLSDQFRERPIKDQMNYLEDLAGSQNQALGMMQDERNALAAEVTTLKALLQNVETALTIQKNIVRDTLTKSNEDVQETAQRIKELEARVKAQDAVIEAHGNHN